jgi:hypothetical protein
VFFVTFRSSRCSLRRSTARMRAISSAVLNGFVMVSSPPKSNPCTFAVSASLSERKIVGTVMSCCCNSAINWNPA